MAKDDAVFSEPSAACGKENRLRTSSGLTARGGDGHHDHRAPTGSSVKSVVRDHNDGATALLQEITFSPQPGARITLYFVSAMKDELRRFASAQASFFYDHAYYTADLDSLQRKGFLAAPGIAITVNEATVSGWSAGASHQQTAVQCYLFSGNAAPLGSATARGTIECG